LGFETNAGHDESRIQNFESRTVSDVGERALIERIRARLPKTPAWVILGPGDDAAVIEPERNMLEVITTDALVEGIHFDRSFVSPADIGHKALAVNLSDLAAMGASPRAALLSLMLPSAWPVAHLDSLLDGMLALAERARISLVGGNITRSPGPLIVDVTVTGSVHRRRILMRSGARAGDEIYVTGSIGAGAAGLSELRANAASVSAAAQRYRRPEPRMRCGLLLGRNRAARSCIDLSDGLADGVRQLGDASGLGAVIEARTLPIEPHGLRMHQALTGGDDYELLFTVAPKLRRRLAGVRRLTGDLPITRIGRMTADRRFLIEADGTTEEMPQGFEHFQHP
jgi:thiamine-monophosphate kinase